MGRIISEQHWKSTFYFAEIVNNYGMKRETMSIVKFITYFSLKLCIQYWKYFHSMVLGSVGRDYITKNGVLEFLAKMFG